MKFFVSCIIPRVKQVGVIQLEADTLEQMQTTAEKLAPCPCEFKAYSIEKWEEELPIGVFISAETLKELGY